MGNRRSNPEEATGRYFRVPVLIGRADLELIDQEAREQGMTLGYLLDLIIAREANRVRFARGLPQLGDDGRLGQLHPSGELAR